MKKNGHPVEEDIADTVQYLTFWLNEEIFAMEISSVREIIEYLKITEVPNTPDFMQGVINLRGEVVPVVNLRLKFGMTQTEKTVDTCIIITETSKDTEMNRIGALVDSVKEVMELEKEEILSTPEMGTGIKTEYIKGMGKQGETFIIILNVEKIFSFSELAFSNATQPNG